jgi:hypothetical protein
MIMRWSLVLVASVLVAATAVSGFAHPEPSSVPFRWELHFEPGELRLYENSLDGRAYWYFTYVVTNRTEEDQLWAPSFTLYTDGGHILASGRDVPPQVEGAIRRLLGNDLLETQNEAIGELYQGREHAKDGLVVWPVKDTKVTELTLFIGGISGETARVMNPLTGEEHILRKTLRRDYIVPGDARARGSRPVELVEQTWVLR